MTAARRQRGYLLLGLVPVVVGSLMFPIQRYVVTHGFLPLAFIAPRFFLGTVTFTLLAVVLEWPWRVSRSDFFRIALLGGSGICVNQIALVLAVRYTTGTTVALFFGTYPVWVALLSQLTRAGETTRRTLFAALVSTVGVAVVVLGASGSVSVSALGLFFALLTPAALAVYTVSMAPVLERRSALQVSAIACLVATPPLFLVSAGELQRQNWSAISTLDWLGFVYAGLIAFVGGFGIMLVVVRLVGATRMSLLMNSQAFLGALFSVLLLSEKVTVVQIAGGGVIAVAIGLAWHSPSSPAELALVEPSVAIPAAASEDFASARSDHAS